MALTQLGLTNLARSVDLRIEALNAPTAPGQPQVFAIRPAALLFSTLGPLIPLGPPISTEAVLNDALSVGLSVTWGVEDASGKRLGPEEAVTYSTVAEALEATVMVVPDFVELRTGIEVPSKTRYVTATVTLTPPGGSERNAIQLQLVRHPITVPAIPVPTVALFFATPNMGMTSGGPNGDQWVLQSGDQFVLVLVPTDSPIGSISALRFAFDKLREVSKTAAVLASLAGVAGSGLSSLTILGGALDSLLAAFNAHALIGDRVGMAFVSADSVFNLNDIDVILGPRIWNNDVEAEDTISSLALVGPPGRQIRLFQHRNFRGQRLDITASSVCVTLLNAGPLDNRVSGVAFL